MTKGLTVTVRQGESPLRAISRLKSKVMKEGTLQMLKDRRYYVKPSIAKRLKSEAAERQRIKDLNKEVKNLLREEQDFLS